MKKYLLIVLFIFIPLTVKAYGIEDYYINATVQENGDLEVEEYYYLNGDYNGTTREILYKNNNLGEFNSSLPYYGGSSINNGDSVEFEKVMGLAQDTNFDFTTVDGDTFKEVDYASKGDYKVYEKENRYNGIFLKIYIPSSKNKAIYLKYKIKNVAVKHNDVAELFWSIFNNNSTESIGNLKITVNFPNNKDEFKVWAHGPLNGDVKKDGNNKLIATINGLSSYTAVDVRATFDKNVISKSTKTTNVDALSKILSYEEDKANQANYERMQNIENDFAYCESIKSRKCYENLVRSVSYVTDEKLKSEYEKRLEVLHTLVIQKEENDAISAVENVEYYLNAGYLEEAYSKVYVLENEELKESLLKRLDVVKKEILKKETKREKKLSTIWILIDVISIGAIIYIYNKYDKEYKTEFDGEYYREIQNGYSPTLLSYLISKKISNDSISATVLQLINKKAISYYKDENDNYILKKQSSYNNPTKIEEKVLDLLFEYGDELKLKDMKKLAKKHYSSYKSNYESIVTNAEYEAKNKMLYEEDEKVKTKSKEYKNSWWYVIFIFIFCFFPPILIFGIILLILFSPILLILYAIKIYRDSKEGYLTKLDFIKKASKIYLVITYLIEIVLIIISVIMDKYIRTSLKFILVNLIIQIIYRIYIEVVKKRSQSAQEDYKKWMSFKRFIQDFGAFDIKDLPEISLWEEYLVYAHVLGVSKKLINDMKLKEIDSINNELITSGDFYMLSHVINSTIRSSYSTAVSAKRAHDYSSSGGGGSSWSSGGGGGGGFSSGGGSGGGGGSVGRF